jgi:hypothetical protein
MKDIAFLGIGSARLFTKQLTTAPAAGIKVEDTSCARAVITFLLT